jgi:hypothetical protein
MYKLCTHQLLIYARNCILYMKPLIYVLLFYTLSFSAFFRSWANLFVFSVLEYCRSRSVNLIFGEYWDIVGQDECWHQHPLSSKANTRWRWCFFLENISMHITHAYRVHFLTFICQTWGGMPRTGFFLHSARDIAPNFPCNQISFLLIQWPYLRYNSLNVYDLLQY